MTFQGCTSTIVALMLFTCHCLGATGHSHSGDLIPTTTISLAADGSSFESKIVESIPHYQPEQSVSGVIRLWGHGNVKLPWMKQLVSFWEEGFKRYHPNVTVQYEMHGTSSAIPALFTGVGDLAILGEEIDPAAAAAFEKVKHYPPLGIEILTGSLDVRNFDYAQMFFVHRDNPISKLTLAQLDAIFGNEHRRGLENIRTWGQLGLTGEWADKPIHAGGQNLSSGAMLQFSNEVLGGKLAVRGVFQDLLVLSQEGQEQVQREGRYLPLSGTMVREQLTKLQ